MQFAAIRALTLDLDDTLWPVAPVIARAEVAMRQWLERHAPATAAAFDPEAMRRLRAQVDQAHPELRHDLSALRRATLHRAVAYAGEPPALADKAFEVFFAARQQVEFYPDVSEALPRLAARFPLWSLSNGNADLHRVGIGAYFRGSMNAAELGAAKPDPRVFAHACRRIGLAPSQVLHVGDDRVMDVDGARAVGMVAVWLHRGPADGGTADGVDAHDPLQVSNLSELADRLGC